MSSFCVRNNRQNKPLKIKGIIDLPGDKSIAHRALIISALCKQPTSIYNFPNHKDSASTVNVFKKLGVRISTSRDALVVHGCGLHGLKQPDGDIFCSESGTTFRLVMGVLAGQNLKAKLTASPSLSRRPMSRVVIPLRMMGAKITSSAKSAGLQEEYPPISIEGTKLKPITYRVPVASAQVKSAILLAGLCTSGVTRVIEPVPTRDHTERMLQMFQARLKVHGNGIFIEGDHELISAGKIYIPADISSAAFFMVAALILPDSKIVMNKVSLNPSRIGVIRVLQRMGADIKVKKHKTKGEPLGDIIVQSSHLKGVVINRPEIPSLIDELPVLMVAACLAQGKSVFKGVQELRVKETDRIQSMVGNLRKMGASIEIQRLKAQENIIIQPVKYLKAAQLKSFGDHRTAMSMIVAGLAAQGCTTIDDIKCIDKSFPGFISQLKKLLINASS